ACTRRKHWRSYWRRRKGASKITCRRCDVMSKGQKRSGAGHGRPQPLRGTKGKRSGARLWKVGGQQFYFKGLRPLTGGQIMCKIQTGGERMPHDLSHLGFLAGQIGRLITISTAPVSAGGSS